MTIHYLGVLRDGGTVACGAEPMGRVGYDIDGFLTNQGEVVASGEIRMQAEMLSRVFGRSDLRLTTDDGHALSVRFSGKRHDAASSAAHADVGGDLPVPKAWRRG